MPLNINAKVITVDQIRIEKFTVDPQRNTVSIMYSRGSTGENGEYSIKEYSHKIFDDVSFDENLYSEVKNILYNMLVNS